MEFTFYNPTKIVFGQGKIAMLASLIPAGKKVMMVYGGGSIKKNGVYDQVAEALKGHKWEEFGGIEANPDFSTCMKCADKIKTTKCDFVLGVGGGSVVDAIKFISSAAVYDGEDAWDIVKSGGAVIKKQLPFADVLTLPATGSEMNAGSVISRRETKEKHPFFSTFPVFSILDPTTTYSLPPVQTANGIADCFCHVMETSVTHTENRPVQDGWSFTILKTLIAEAPAAFKNPNDYESRANIMWACTVGLNGFLSPGIVQDWATHMIGHELTAEFGIDHGRTLSVVGPSLYRHQFEVKKHKLAKLGKEVFGIAEADVDLAAHRTIDAIEAFYREGLGIKTKLSEYPVIKDPKSVGTLISKKFEARDPHTKLGENNAIGIKEIKEILDMSV